MKRTWTIVRLGLLGSILAAAVAQGDVTGSFDGSLTGKKVARPLSTAAVLAQTGAAVSGTIALPADLATFGGAYLVNGKATAKGLSLSGVGPGGATFRWRARLLGDTAMGKGKMKRPGTKLSGMLTLTRNPTGGDGSGCDGVFTQNQSLFVDRVLGQALLSCPTCHAPGLQAGATRLHVMPGDPLATARAIALLVDPANPPASKILGKPLNVLPHGGGMQITPGSTPAEDLQQWIDLVAQAHCN